MIMRKKREEAYDEQFQETCGLYFLGRIFYGRGAAHRAAQQGQHLSGRRSKDPNTQVGACIVSQDNKIMSMGYNGFPKGCSDDEFPWGREQEADDPYSTKYLYVTHSELNAILNYRGGSLEGSKIYVTLFPCNECAKAIIQAGIKTIIYKEDKYPDSPSVRASKRMLNAAGVRYYQYDQTGRKIEIDV